MTQPLRIVFFGTSSFAARILASLAQQPWEIVGIVTRVDKPFGRKLQLKAPPVKEAALEHFPHIPLFQPIKASTPEFAETLKGLNADLFVVVAYGEIIKQSILDIPRYGCVNIHASLLPYFRGAAPIQRCLMHGEKKSGVTLIEMTAEMDAGAMLAREEIEIPLSMTYGELEPALCELGSHLLTRVLTQYATHTVLKIPQNHTEATFAPKLTPDDERIDWKKDSLAIHNQIRALSPKPGAWALIEVKGEPKRLKIKRSYPLSERSGLPGELLECDKNGMVVACGQGAIQILEVQLEGKKQMAISEFLAGLQEKIKMII